MTVIFYDIDHNELSRCEAECSPSDESRLNYVYAQPEFGTDEIKFVYYHDREVRNLEEEIKLLKQKLNELIQVNKKLIQDIEYIKDWS